jgi:hypothetical protein
MLFRALASLLLATVLTVFAGCDGVAPSDDLLVAEPATAASVDSEIILNGHEVEFLGAVAVPGGTEFSYQVTRVEPGPLDLDWFFLENACGEDALQLTPPEVVRPAVIDEVPGYQWTWNPSATSAIQTGRYTYTFADALLGVVQVKLQQDGVAETGLLPGPCGGLAALSGSVFVNADEDPDRAANELGIEAVRVEVYDGEPSTTPVAVATTGADGRFSFTLLRSEYTEAGYYTVVVPEAADGTFNETLYLFYDYVLGGVAGRQVVLDSDVDGVDLGFDPDRPQLILDLSEGTHQTDARSVNSWRQFVRDALDNRPCDTSDPDDVCREALLFHLRDILDDPYDPDDAFYLLSSPFQGPSEWDGDVLLSWALDRLSDNPTTDVEEVGQKLFAMQLNNENGWGTGDPPYENALQAYLEEWVNNNGGSLRPGSDDTTAGLGPGGPGGPDELAMANAYLRGGPGGPDE